MFPWRACLLYARLSYALLADDPFAKRAKAGLGLKRTITVDELGKMEAGPSRVQLISSAAELKKALTAAGRKLVVVDFFATWCGPCKQIAPQFAELSGQHKKVVFLKVDVDKCPNLAATHGVTSMPTFLFLKGSKVVSKQAGASIECKLPAGLCGAYNSSLPSRTRTTAVIQSHMAQKPVLLLVCLPHAHIALGVSVCSRQGEGCVAGLAGAPQVGLASCTRSTLFTLLSTRLIVLLST